MSGAMGQFEVTTQSADSTAAFGRVLGPLVRSGDVVLLTGDLGAGKTQFTKGLAEGMSVEGPVTSPTFNILLVHEGRIPLYHMDLYRLDDAEQLVDLDYFGVVEGDGVAVVEWGDRFADAVPVDGLLISFTIAADTVRLIRVVALGRRGEDLIESWRDALAGIDGVTVEHEGIA